MITSTIDLVIIGAFLVSVIGIGIAGMRKSSGNAEAFFQPCDNRHFIPAGQIGRG